MRVAVDTSVLVAIFVPDDTWRSQAASLVSDLRRNQASTIYFDCVIAEALNTAVRRLHERRQSERIPVVIQRFRHELPVGNQERREGIVAGETVLSPSERQVGETW